MSEYRLEGGPHDGRRVTTNGARILRMPVQRPLNVLTLTRGPQVAMDIAEYERFGEVYRYDRLIGDAWAEMAVTDEAFREPQVRRLVREQMRRRLEHLDPSKQVDTIIWRIVPDRRIFTWSVRAFVGPTRVQRARIARDEMRSLAVATPLLHETP